MLLWEISAFNRMFRTDIFECIRARCKGLNIVFAMTETKKVSTMLSLLQPTDILPGDDALLRTKYGLDKSGDLSTLYLFECISSLAQQHQLIAYEEAKAFTDWIVKGYKLSIINDEQRLKQELQELNVFLSIRTTVLGYRITMADLFLLSGLKRNEKFTAQLQATYQHIARWIDWVQALLGVDYDRITRQLSKKVKEQHKSLVRLTSSKELINAVKASDYPRVEALLLEGANIESCDFTASSMRKGPARENAKSTSKPHKEAKKMPLEQTVLHIACDKNDIKMAKLFVEKGANVNSEDRDGMTPLYYAILRKSEELCDYLLAHGANLEHKECQLRTPLYWTSSLGEIDMLEYLIKKGANVNAPSKLGRSALSKACWNGQIHILERLLKCKDLDVNQADELGRTPLHNAAWGKEGGREGIKTSINGRDSPECVALLLDHGANMMAGDNKGNTALHVAANTNAPDSLQLMLNKGGDVNCRNQFLSTPLHKCCKYGTLPCVQVLLKNGANLEAKDKRGLTAFDYLLLNSDQKSISDGHLAILHYLLGQTEYPSAAKFVRMQFCQVQSLLCCIDNDAHICLELLLTHFAEEFKTEVKDYLPLIRRCLFLNSAKCLSTILTLKPDIKITPCELELAVYFANPETIADFINRFYAQTPAAERRLEERVVKACIRAKRPDPLESMLELSKACRYEFADIISQVEPKDWVKDELTHIFNLEYLKQKKTYNFPKFAEIYAEYNDHNVLQLAIEHEAEEFALMLMKTDVSLWANRKSDGATCLILATKKGMHSAVETIMNKYWERVKDRSEVQKYVEYKDTAGISVLDYCKIRGRQDIYSTIKCFCTDEAKIVGLEYRVIEEKKEWTKKQQEKIEERMKVNLRLEGQKKIVDAFSLPDFQYPRLDALTLDPSGKDVKSIPRHDCMPCVWVDTEKSLADMAATILKSHRAIGVDTEYHDFEKNVTIICLLQISTLDCDYVVDSFALREIIPKYLAPIFESSSIVKVMHGCDADLPLLITDYDIYCNNLFDTGRAYSFLAQSSSETIKKCSLSSLEKLITNVLGVKIDKFFQLADWRIRPIPPPMLSYARTDSHYLIYLYHILGHRLNELKTSGNRLVELAMECNSLLIRRMAKVKNKRVQLIAHFPKPL